MRDYNFIPKKTKDEAETDLVVLKMTGHQVKYKCSVCGLFHDPRKKAIISFNCFDFIYRRLRLRLGTSVYRERRQFDDVSISFYTRKFPCSYLKEINGIEGRVEFYALLNLYSHLCLYYDINPLFLRISDILASYNPYIYIRTMVCSHIKFARSKVFGVLGTSECNKYIESVKQIEQVLKYNESLFTTTLELKRSLNNSLNGKEA